jgi:predicted DNA-binding transcriptional regulator YafY
MNRTDRLLAIVVALQAKGRLRAVDLAELFETSPRTIYRDIQALSEAGVPLVAVPGQGYSLMEGYFLPPLTFTADEAALLLLGSDVMARSFDERYRAVAEGAGRKIAAVLPERVRDEVQDLRESVHFVPERAAVPDAALALLRRAIADRTAVQLRYHTRHRADEAADRSTTREIDPYALAHMAGAWYLTGYDHLRKAVRTFRLDRIEEIAVLERTFVRPRGAHLRGREGERRPIEVRALFDGEVARWVREGRSFFTVAEEEVTEGLLVTLRVRQESEVLSWLLGWGRHVQVLEPESLRRRIAEEAKALLRAHGDESCRAGGGSDPSRSTGGRSHAGEDRVPDGAFLIRDGD